MKSASNEVRKIWKNKGKIGMMILHPTLPLNEASLF
jgi:hypothetical protein